MARILIVEDDAANIRLAATILESAGHEPLRAERAEAGIEIARRERPDLILMDIHLPGMDGLTATRLLKADPATAAIPVIALTASAMAGDRERILAAGCDDYLAKPVHHRDLIDHIARLTGASVQPERPAPTSGSGVGGGGK